MGTRRIFAIGVVVVAILVGGLLWKLRATESSQSSSATKAQANATSATATPATAPSPAKAPGLAAPAESGSDEQRPQPVPVDPATAPSLDAPHSQPAPPQKPFTRDETIAKREADLKLLDDTKTRLEGDLAAAKAGKNASAAHDLEVRLARLADLKKKRTGELEQIRAGGALPQ